MLIPYRINTLFQTTPFANWFLIGITGLISLTATYSGGDWIYGWILDGWSPSGMVGHLFIHNGIFHLAGNLVFLWVFGNAICGNTNNLIYPQLYLGFGLVAAGTHNIFDGELAVGASGAINGIVGMATALYPKNSVGMFWFFFIRFGTFEVPLWIMSMIWFAFDLFGVFFGSGDVAVWAHIGGFFAGLITGILFLRNGIITLTEWDNESMSDLLARR